MARRKSNFVVRAWETSPLAFIVGGVVLFFGAKWALRKLLDVEKRPPRPKPLPHGGGGVPSGWSPEPFSDELFQVMDGWFDSVQSKAIAFAKVIAMTDDQLTAVYNDWNRKYAVEEEATLTQRIRDESMQPGNADTLISRLMSLRLN